MLTQGGLFYTSSLSPNNAWQQGLVTHKVKILNDEYFGSLPLCLLFFICRIISEINLTDCNKFFARGLRPAFFFKKRIKVFLKHFVKGLKKLNKGPEGGHFSTLKN